jgi:hypothetical protein
MSRQPPLTQRCPRWRHPLYHIVPLIPPPPPARRASTQICAGYLTCVVTYSTVRPSIIHGPLGKRAEMGCCCCTMTALSIFFPASAGQMIVSSHGAAAAHVARWRVRSGWLARRGGRRSSTAVTKLLEDDDQSPSERIREEAREGGDAAVGRRRGHLLYHEICSHSSILGHGMMGKRPGQTGSLSLMAHCSTFDDTAC